MSAGSEPSAERLRDHILQAVTAGRSRQFQKSRETLIQATINANKVTIATDPDVAKLFARYCETAVVVGAGPTLDLSLNRIKTLQAQGAQVVCVDAALQPLKVAGIKPGYIVTLDPLPEVIRFFEINLTTLNQTSLVYFPSVDQVVVQRWPHDRYAAYTTHQRYNSLRIRIARTSLFASGSVIHPATDLAIRLGATTVYLAGADFGFPFNLTHASSSVFCKASPTCNLSGLTVATTQAI